MHLIDRNCPFDLFLDRSISLYLTIVFCFVLQYIGSLDVPRPNSRMEIVAAMRRIRVSDHRAVIPLIYII